MAGTIDRSSPGVEVDGEGLPQAQQDLRVEDPAGEEVSAKVVHTAMAAEVQGHDVHVWDTNGRHRCPSSDINGDSKSVNRSSKTRVY